MEHQALGIVSVIPYGDQAGLIRFEDRVDDTVRKQVLATQRALQQEEIVGITAFIPAHTSLVVYFDLTQLTFPRLQQYILKLTPIDYHTAADATTWHIPVCYGGEFGPDLASVAAFHSLSEEQMIALHSEQVYDVYLLGFMPGFAYLGSVPTLSATPRRQTPRVNIPFGSVAMAGHQTCIYPSESAGGWQIIGRTPISLLNERLHPPIMWQAGDWVRFIPIAPTDWNDWRADMMKATTWDWLKAT